MTNLANATFKRASTCDNSGGSCLEVAMLGDTVITRDSKDPQGTVQAYTRSEWITFIDAVKGGEFDI
jgi:uncharacterized protein DUF397